MKERSRQETSGTGEERRPRRGERRREARKGILGQREACSCRSAYNVLPWRRHRCAGQQVGEVSQGVCCVSAGTRPGLSAPPLSTTTLGQDALNHHRHFSTQRPPCMKHSSLSLSLSLSVSLCLSEGICVCVFVSVVGSGSV